MQIFYLFRLKRIVRSQESRKEPGSDSQLPSPASRLPAPFPYEKRLLKFKLYTIRICTCFERTKERIMEKLRKWVALTLLFTLVTTSIQGQDQNPYNQGDDAYSSAYMQSSHAAHWSAYVPITILVVAAIYLGMADQSHDYSSHSSDSQDALGSIDSSKRHSSSSSSYSSSNYYSSKNYSYSSNGYSHN